MIHPVFHASLLTPYSEMKEHGENYSRPPPDLVAGEEQYEVESIHSHRRQGRGKQLQYLVKWAGYPESDNTWEPAKHLQALLLLKEYHRRVPIERINSGANQQRQHSPTWLPPTTHLIPPLSTGTSLRQRGTSTTTTPRQQRQRSPDDAAGLRNNPRSTTPRPMLPSAATLCASTTAKQCRATQTHPSTHPP